MTLAACASWRPSVAASGREYRSRAIARPRASLRAGGRSGRPVGERGDVGPRHVAQQFLQLLAPERALAGEALVEGQGQRVDVAAGIDLLPLPLLRRHVGERAHQVAVER